MRVIQRLRRAAVGMAQWMGGREITEPALPRLALSSWTASLRAESSPVRRHVLVTALRNRLGFKGVVNSDSGITTSMVWGVEALTVEERLAELDLETGHAEVTANLEALVAADPYREHR